MKVQWFKVHSKARSRLSPTHLPDLPVQPLSRVKTLDGPRVRVVSPLVKEKVYGGKDLLKSQVLSSEWNTERVREDASGDSEDGEDDELPCVIGESARDCINLLARFGFHFVIQFTHIIMLYVVSCLGPFASTFYSTVIRLLIDLWHWKPFQQSAPHVMNVFAKFHSNPSTKYGDNESREYSC